MSSKRFSGENHEYENEDDTDACNQCDYESTNISDLKARRRAQYTNGSDVCDISLENNCALRRHRRSQDDEMDERYSISRVGGRNGQWIFTCKTCEAHSSHRDAWKHMIRQSMRRVEPNNPIGFVFTLRRRNIDKRILVITHLQWLLQHCSFPRKLLSGARRRQKDEQDSFYVTLVLQLYINK